MGLKQSLQQPAKLNTIIFGFNPIADEEQPTIYFLSKTLTETYYTVSYLLDLLNRLNIVLLYEMIDNRIRKDLTSY